MWWWQINIKKFWYEEVSLIMMFQKSFMNKIHHRNNDFLDRIWKEWQEESIKMYLWMNVTMKWKMITI